MVAPINIIIIGQIALLLTTSLHQTPADGNPVLPIYLMLAALCVLIMLPLTPFLHRFTFQIPTILFFVFVGCLIHNLLAFPFSRDARLKHYFVQTIDLDTGANNVTLSGVDEYVQAIIAKIPSSAGQTVHCGVDTPLGRSGLQTCAWPGLSPQVVPADYSTEIANKHDYESWLDYNITTSHKSTATFTFRGLNTKAYRLVFDHPASSVVIEDSATDPRFPTSTEEGISQVRLFSRDWDKTFTVNVTWEGQEAKGQTGRVVALWSDANDPELIPAYDEVRRFEPVWSAVTKAGDGLVEGFKTFEVR
jgi:hypothetical protein